MKKTKEYKLTKFSSDVLRDAIGELRKIDSGNKRQREPYLRVDTDDATWLLDTLEEFLADYRKYEGGATCIVYTDSMMLSVTHGRYVRETTIEVEGVNRPDIEAIFAVFEKHAAASRIPAPPAPEPVKPVVFIGHGHSPAWRDLKDHLSDKHGFRVIAYETGARAGHGIRDILEEMVKKSTFALLVLTAEDEQRDGQLRARQNVIHETGLFQGRLGFHRAILLLENGVEEFSNVQGVQYIGFNKGNIRETFGEVLATLKREFPGTA